MTKRDFIELGYLQEANRCFFHPLGLALELDNPEANLDEDLGHSLSIVDGRDNPPGFIFAPGLLDREKAEGIAEEFVNRAGIRIRLFGHIIQEVPGGPVARELE